MSERICGIAMTAAGLAWLMTAGALAEPLINLPPTVSGGGAYALIPDGYISVAPPGTNMYLRIQNSGFGTMSISELALGDSYLVSYYAVNRHEIAKNDFKVSVDGEVKIGGPLFTVAGANVWTNQVSGTNLAFNFTATGTTATLKFEALFTDGGDRTVGFASFSIATNPPQPVTVQALNATEIRVTNATLRGMVAGTGGGGNPQVVFCWGLTNRGTSSTGDWSFAQALGANWGAGVPFGTNVGALTMGTTYWYQCYASNAAGADWSDNAQSFTTLAPATVSNAGSVVDSIWANLSGAVIASGGETPTLWLHYWLSGGESTSVVSLGPKTNGATFLYRLTGLTTNTAYAFAFLSSNLAGLAWSGTKNFTTFASPPFLNAGFEDNGPTYNSSINTFKTPVTNWTVIVGGSANVGVMCNNSGDAYTGGTGFKSQMIGLESGGAISQTASNFTAGQNYLLEWEGNARPSYGDGGLRITAGGRIVWGDTCVVKSGAFLTYTSFPFTATSSAMTIQWEKALADNAATLLDNLRILPTANRVAPFVDAIATASSGSANYTSVDPGYGVTPYEGLTQLRMTGISSYTMTIRELRRGGRINQVSLYVCNRSGEQNPCQVKVDGKVCLGGPGYTITGNSWTNRTFNFTSTGTTATLTFDTFQASSTVFFDAWRVTDLGPAYRGTVLKLY